MKNFKKVISLVLALAMVLSIATTAFAAATTTEEKAEVLYELDLFEGKSTTSYVPDLEGSTDRQQAMVMLDRAFAWGTVAGTTSTFPDDATWAEPSVAEAVAREITNGVGDGTTFGATNTVSEREVATWIDRALGAELEGSWEANEAMDSTTPLTRGDLVDMIWEALMETPEGGTETLIETIVGTNDAKIEIAVEAGLIEQARLTPEIILDEDALVEIASGEFALRADGAAAVLVKFQLTDSITGLPAVTDRDYEVAFSATFGTFAEQRVTSENGVASVLLTSEFLTEDVVSTLTAKIIESEREEDEIIGNEVSIPLVMSPNPEALSDDSVGASITDAEANEADRIILYFNKDVNVDAFILSAAEATATSSTTDAAGDIDPLACAIEVRENSTSATTGTVVAVESLAPLKDFDGAEIPNALQVILDVDADPANALTDNSDVFVSFTDRTKALDVPSTNTFKNTDVRKPSMLAVEVVNLTTIRIDFSEAVLDESGLFSAENLNNWQINGTLVGNPAWNATVNVGEFVSTTGTDARHEVTIALGTDIFGDQIYFQPGTYSVQAANIGDWAKLSDDKNVMNTQTLDFVIEEDTTVPVPTITVMSPEQYLVEWNCLVGTSFAPADAKVQKYNSATAAWDDFGGSALLDPATNVADGDLEFTLWNVTATTDTVSKFIIETDLDWTVEYNTESTRKNYFNDLYQVFFKAGTVTNIANGKVNAETKLQLTDEMYSPDTTSPTIVSIVENATTSTNYDVTFTEPVKEPTIWNGADTDDDDVADAAIQDFATPDQEHGGTAANANDWNQIPEATYEFISDDFNYTVDAKPISIDRFHQVVTVQPDEALANVYVGGWTLVVRSISDDVGNTLPTDTEDFVVAGAATTATPFDIEWIFADVDFNLDVDHIDEENGPQTDWEVYNQADADFTYDINEASVLQATDDTDDYDFVFIKFTKAVATSGDFKNVLKTSNYTIDGASLPVGTSIVANIENYDDFDAVVDSVTIRLPQGYLETVNAPHNINISQYLESAAGDLLGANGGEKTLEYVQSAKMFDWDHDSNTATADLAVSFREQLSADLTVAALLLAMQDDYEAAIVSLDGDDIDDYETTYIAADNAVTAMNTSSSVVAEYKSYLNSTWTALHNAIVSNNLFLIADGSADDEEIELVLGDGDSDHIYTDGEMTASAFIVEGTDVADDALVTAGGNDPGADIDTAAPAVADSVVTVKNVFWGVSATVTIDITADDTYTVDDEGEATSSYSTTRP